MWGVGWQALICSTLWRRLITQSLTRAHMHSRIHTHTNLVCTLILVLVSDTECKLPGAYRPIVRRPTGMHQHHQHRQRRYHHHHLIVTDMSWRLIPHCSFDQELFLSDADRHGVQTHFPILDHHAPLSPPRTPPPPSPPPPSPPSLKEARASLDNLLYLHHFLTISGFFSTARALAEEAGLTTRVCKALEHPEGRSNGTSEKLFPELKASEGRTGASEGAGGSTEKGVGMRRCWSLRMSFSLPPGSYATMMLRELTKSKMMESFK